MKVTSKQLALLVGILPTLSSPQANAALDPTGFWYTEGQRAKVELAPCGNAICGKIISLKEPIDPETKQPKLDKHNPDEGKRNQPLIGMQNISGFKHEGDHKWSDGEIYDPKEGKTYSGYFTMTDPNKIELRGYVLGIPLFGKTQEWTRTTR